MGWQVTRVVRFMREMLPQPEGEWAALLRGVNALAAKASVVG